MVIIQLNINDKGPYNFILDTGVGLMLITDPSLVDAINIPYKRILKIKGVGEGADFDAYFTCPLNIDIKGLVSKDVSVAILKTEHFGLSNYAGIPIHGLLGYEFFNKLAVKIDFNDSTLSVSRPNNLRIFRKAVKIPVRIEDKKPYILTDVTSADGVKTNNKLLVDLGAGHPLSLENNKQNHCLPEKFITGNLGVGLTGPVNGFICRVNELSLNKYNIKNITASFPLLTSDTIGMIHRDGSLGMGILKRFSVIIDYPDSALYLKPRENLKEPFEHDMSGLEYYSCGDDYKRIVISRVEPGSSAQDIGLEKDDEIVAINFKPVKEMNLEQIDGLFRSNNNRGVLLQVYHYKKIYNVILTLKRRV